MSSVGAAPRAAVPVSNARGAAMAEFWRALKTLKALQAEQADVLEQAAGADLALELPVTQLAAPAPVRAQSPRPAARRAHADRRGPNEPERLMAYVLPDPPMAGPALHEPAACTPRRPEPNEPERAPQAPSTVASRAATRSGTAARPTCRCSSRARRCSARSEVRFLNLGLSRFRSGSGRPDHRRQWPRRSVDGPLAVRGERVSSPRA